MFPKDDAESVGFPLEIEVFNRFINMISFSGNSGGSIGE